MASPQTISKMPTVRLYHFEGILTPKSAVSGNTLAYFTYSVRCNTEKDMLKWNKFKIWRAVPNFTIDLVSENK